MGSRIAARLLAAGYSVSVFDKNSAKVAALRGKGAIPSDSVAELAKSVQVLASATITRSAMSITVPQVC
jgi:3-hydroxyisobutyrate dehydrogenase-like beta-hydroxyacid dehydrogenase